MANITKLTINGNTFTGGSGSSGTSQTLTPASQKVINGTNIVTIDPNLDNNFIIEINQNSSLSICKLSSGACKI